MGLVNHLENPKLWTIAHKNGRKRKNDEFLVMQVKQVLSVMGLKITPKTQNCGLLLTKMAQKCKNDKFLVMPLKHVLSVMGHVNPPRTPKQ
jgi:hypothetical protein